MRYACEPVLVDLSSDDDDPEDQTSSVFPVPLVRRAVAGPPKKKHPSMKKLEKAYRPVYQYSPARAGPSKRKHPPMRYQDNGSLLCQYCPFRTNLPFSMKNHESHHSANYAFKCSYCSFSSSFLASIKTHTNRVHKEEMQQENLNSSNSKRQLLKKKMRSSTEFRRPVDESDTEELDEVNDDSEQSDTEDEANREVFHSDGINEHPSEDPLYVNNITQNEITEIEEVPYFPRIPKVEVVDLSVETDEEEDGMVHEDLDEVNCLCGQHQPEIGGQFMICCDQCDDWFHGSCVNISEVNGKQMERDGVDWYCPRCIHSEPPGRHPTKLVQAVDTVTKQFLTTGREEFLRHPLPAISHPELEDVPAQLGNGVVVMEPELQQDEEAICRVELARLAQGIKEAQVTLKKAEQAIKEVGLKMRESRRKKVDKSREIVEELEMKERALTLERRVYLGQKSDVDKKLMMLTTEKIQLERELIKLKDSSVSRLWVKPDPSGSQSAATFSWNRVVILEKETRLGEIKRELEESLKWDGYLGGRILEVEKNLAETVQTLLESRADCN